VTTFVLVDALESSKIKNVYKVLFFLKTFLLLQLIEILDLDRTIGASETSIAINIIEVITDK